MTDNPDEDRASCPAERNVISEKWLFADRYGCKCAGRNRRRK